MTQNATIETHTSGREPEGAQQRIDTILADAGRIATMPEVTVKIIDIVENPKSNMQDLHDVIRNDPVLSTRILKVVNSALYGMPTQVANIDRAIVLLGLSAVKNIAIAASMTHLFTGDLNIGACSANNVWRHSIAMGVGAKLIFNVRKRPGADEGFLAGLVADLGLLIERQAMSDKLRVVVQRFMTSKTDYCALEREVLGVDHQQVGMTLARNWRFPEQICLALGHHHNPFDAPTIHREMPLTVHLADMLTSKLDEGFCTQPYPDEFDAAVLNQLQISREGIAHVLKEMPGQIESALCIFES